MICIFLLRLWTSNFFSNLAQSEDIDYICEVRMRVGKVDERLIDWWRSRDLLRDSFLPAGLATNWKLNMIFICLNLLKLEKPLKLMLSKEKSIRLDINSDSIFVCWKTDPVGCPRIPTLGKTFYIKTDEFSETAFDPPWKSCKQFNMVIGWKTYPKRPFCIIFMLKKAQFKGPKLAT